MEYIQTIDNYIDMKVQSGKLVGISSWTKLFFV
jgi:hypothetical protein